MATLKHRLEYLVVVAGISIARSLSPKMADKLGAGLGWLTYHLWGRRRFIALENLRHAFGNSKSEREYREICLNVFRNIGRTLIEFARFGKYGIPGVKAIMVSPGDASLREALSRGKGAVIITAHYGNWEMLGVFPRTHGHHVDLVIGTQHNPLVDKLLVGFRESMGVGIIPLKTALRGVFKALNQNHIVALAADQHDPGNHVIIDFFGRPSSWPKGPAVFSMRSGAPIIPLLLTRERYDRHVVIAGEPIYPTQESGDDAIHEMTERYAKFFETCIREHPEQWMWTHRRWKV